MAARKSTRVSFVESNWKPYLKLVESGRLRRGRMAAKHGEASALSVHDHYLTCRVKTTGVPAAVCQVQLPCVDWWEPYMENVILWLCRRPDWLASLLAQEWPHEFLDFVHAAGLRLFPDDSSAQQIYDGATCSCNDLEPPCKHIVAAVYRLMSDLSECPMKALYYVGLPNNLLDRVHASTAKLIGAKHVHRQVEAGEPSLDETILPDALQRDLRVHIWPEELDVLTCTSDGPENIRPQSMNPVFDPEKKAAWEQTYLAWKPIS